MTSDISSDRYAAGLLSPLGIPQQQEPQHEAAAVRPSPEARLLLLPLSRVGSLALSGRSSGLTPEDMAAVSEQLEQVQMQRSGSGNGGGSTGTTPLLLLHHRSEHPSDGLGSLPSLGFVVQQEMSTPEASRAHGWYCCCLTPCAHAPYLCIQMSPPRDVSTARVCTCTPQKLSRCRLAGCAPEGLPTHGASRAYTGHPRDAHT